MALPDHPFAYPRTRFVRVWDAITTAAITAAAVALAALPAGCSADFRPADPSPIQVGVPIDTYYERIVSAVQAADACTLRPGDNLHARIAACRQADRVLQDAGLWVASCRDHDGAIIPTDACLEEGERLWEMSGAR